MRRRFSKTARRVISVGCAVKTGCTSISPEAARACSSVTPAFFIRSSVPRNEPGSGGSSAMQFSRAAAALAMIGLGQVGQFEIGGERLGHAVSSVNIERCDGRLGLLQQRICIVTLRACSSCSRC